MQEKDFTRIITAMRATGACSLRAEYHGGGDSMDSFGVSFADGKGNDLSLPEEVYSDIKDRLYDLLEGDHQGWENNDGGYGEISLDLDDGVPTLDWSHYDYVVDTSLTSHEF
jgi:hypothetical protein